MATAEQRSLEEFLKMSHKRPSAADAPAPVAAGFRVEDGFVVHPGIAPGAIEARAYQLTLAARATRESLLVVLPTGLGKTVVAALAAADAVTRREGKVLFMAPTRPLVQQHHDTFKRWLSTGDMTELTGRMSPARRSKLFTTHKILFSTPQGLWNDIEAGLIDLGQVALLVVDEAHRAVGEYDYVNLCKAYQTARPNGRTLALTASPGGDGARVREVLEGLQIHAVEARGPEDADVAPYVQEIHMEWRRVKLPPAMKKDKDALDHIVKKRTHHLKRLRLLPPKPYVSRKDLIETGNKIRARLQGAGRNKGMYFGLIKNQGVAMQALHCVELLETQGIEPLRDYLERTAANPTSKSEQALLKEPAVVDLLARLPLWNGPSHPKMPLLLEVLNEEFARNPDSLIIVFAQYRDTIKSILKTLDAAGIAASRFVGQGSRDGDPGLTQDDQRAILEQFRAKRFRVLVASSVAEEGLDIPAVDRVVFYEPVPSEIRLIQRRGRTGRRRMGQVTVLIAEGTRDEAFLYAGTNREKKMRRIVKGLGEEGTAAAGGADGSLDV